MIEGEKERLREGGWEGGRKEISGKRLEPTEGEQHPT